MKASYLIRGTPGHPLHPPLTDATIGSYTVATALGVLGWFGVAETDLSKGWWLALIVGLIASAPTALTGFADWLQIPKETPLWRTASLHALTNVVAASLFSLAAIVGHIPFHEARVSGGALLLTVAGFAVLTLGGVDRRLDHVCPRHARARARRRAHAPCGRAADGGERSRGAQIAGGGAARA